MNNPTNNNLVPGITELDILTSVTKSGYPLQTEVARSLGQRFHVKEEWSYVDDDTRELRAIDILAELEFWDLGQEHPRVRPYLDLGIAVLDAQMVGVRVPEQSQGLILLPWVRVVRHEADRIPDWPHGGKIFAIDIVHKDFLQEYLNKHVIPFAEEFSRLAIKHQQVIASREGFVPGMGKDSWGNIEQRLTVSSRVTRARAAGRIILKSLTARTSKGGEADGSL